MHESAPTTVPAFPPGRSRRRKRWLLAAIPLCLLLSAVVLSFYGLFSSNHQLQEAIAEADRLDPAWRQAALEAPRAGQRPGRGCERMQMHSALRPCDWR